MAASLVQAAADALTCGLLQRLLTTMKRSLETRARPPPALLLIGLRNPGVRYERTRHNVGAMALDAIVEGMPFDEWEAADGAAVMK